MDIYIVRHGKAEKRVAEGKEDEKRGLTAKGRKEVRKIASWLKESAPLPDWIATSPLVRARETASIIAQEMGKEDSIEEWDELSPGHDPKDLLDRLALHPGDSIGMVVGHEPQLSQFLALLISGNTSPRIVLAKGAISCIRGTDTENSEPKELKWLVTPDIVGK
ncbi:MAG: phosphohistidine phosphatase SixA [Methanolinea sp.]|nr:phosphohistidine phosphatase SixA [Methanolinea sp.]